MVLAAGFGTRLQPLTDEVPKPLLPVGVRPLLLQLLEELHEQGAEKLLVNAHHHGDEISIIINCLGFKVHLLLEERILGTAGGIAGARAHLSGLPLVVVNGDIVGAIPLGPLLDRAGPGLTLAVVPASSGGGTVGIGAQGEVVRLRGEVFGHEVTAGDYMGMAVLGADGVARLPSEGCLIGDFALPELRLGRSLRVAWVESTFTDIGTRADLLRANLDWLRGSGRAEVGPAGARYFVGEGATVEPAVHLVDSLVSAGARVTGEGLVERTIVLAGASAVAPLRDSAVLPSGRVVKLS